MACESLEGCWAHRPGPRPIPNQDFAHVVNTRVQAKLTCCLSGLHSGMTPPGDAVEVRGLSILGAAAGELKVSAEAPAVCGLEPKAAWELSLGDPTWGCIPGVKTSRSPS